MPTQETRPKIKNNRNALDTGNKQCKTAIKQFFGNFMWMIGNLPNEKQVAIHAILNHLVRSSDYLDLESTDGLPLDVWCEFRDDLSDAFQGQFTSLDLVALVDAANKFNVPRQYFFDVLEGVDTWIRNRGFQTFDDLLVFAYRMGGAPLAASVPVCGYVKDGYEEAAIKAGQAIFLTQILANMVQDIKLNKMYFAREDIEVTEVSIARIKVRQSNKELRHLIRLYGSRIEKLMYQGGALVNFLDFDGRRCFTSLVAVHWAMLMKMRLRPESVLNPEGILSRREMFLFKSRHFMGLEGNVPVIPEVHNDH